MKKVVKILEQYVQWVAVVIGLGFLGYMGWVYVYNNPAAVQGTIHNVQTTVNPGDVDPLINDECAEPLETAMHNNQTITFPPVAATNPPLGTSPTPLATTSAFDSFAFDVSTRGAAGQAGPQVTVQALPTPPALKYVDQEPLRTVIQVNDPNGQPVNKDQDSVTTFWSVPVSDLAQVFKGAFGNLPQPQQLSSFIRFDLVREEKMPDGTWGNDQAIPLPPLPPGTAAQPEWPAGNDPNAVTKYQDYINWARPLSQWLMNPTYPAVAYDRADLQWQPLATWIPYRANYQYNENLPVNVPLPTPAPAPPPPPPSGPVYGGGGGPFGGPFGGGGRGNGYGGPAPMGRGGPSFVPPPQPQPVVQAPPTSQPAVVIPPIPSLQQAPSGQFNPGNSQFVQQGDVGFWFHDMTVAPEKVYRYKVRYYMENPVFNKPERAANPKMAAIPALISDFSAWSDPVNVPARTQFWCVKQQPGNPAGGLNPLVGFAVYSWHDGLWREKDYNCSPGDEIGADEGATVGNFITRWTMLEDVRAGSDHLVLIVPDDGGPAQERNVDADPKSQSFLHFQRDFQNQQLIQQQQQPAAQATPAPGGMLPQ